MAADEIHKKFFETISSDHIIEEHIEYEVRLEVGEDGKMRKDYVETKLKTIKKPNRLDPNTMKIFIDMFKEMKANTMMNTTAEMDNLENLTADQLQEKIDEQKKILLTAREKIEMEGEE